MDKDASNSKVYTENAELYDILYGGGGDDYFEFLLWIIEYCGISRTEKILDMGSGTGRLLLPLVKHGYEVEGQEPFEGMREITLKKAKEWDVEINLNEGSFQSLNKLDYYSLIYSLDGTMAYHETVQEYKSSFRNVANALRSGGYFIVDMMNFYSLIKNYKYPEVQKFKIGNKKITALIHHEIDRASEFWYHKSTVIIEEDGKITQLEDIHKLNMISRKLLIELGRQVGLKVDLLLNSIYDRPDDRKGGSRNIILFQKP